MKKEISKFVGSKIKEIRKKEGLTQKELGDKVGVKHNTISSYENGTNEPEQNILYSMASELGVSINDFFPNTNYDVIREELVAYTSSNSEKEYAYYPTSVSAGLPLNIDSVTDAEQIEIPDLIMGKYAGNKDVYVTKINGDSMDKQIPDGSLIVVKPVQLESLKQGDIVVFSNGHEYSVKSFYRHSDKLIFRPNSKNDAHYDQSYSIDDNIVIHGRVVLYIVELD